MIRDPRKLADTDFDLLIVGGGIHGACVAREAALRGLRAALVDRDDFGAATSHNSLKIVHGGLRYLQHADFARTRESVCARSAWLREAPHLVRPLGFLMPLQGWLARGPAALWAAMRVHELIGWDRNQGLADDRRLPRGRLVAAEEVRRIMPGLSDTKLTGGAIWYDGHMLDADRLLLACVEDAVAHGAVVCNHARARSIDVSRGRVRGAGLVDELTGETLFVRAERIVNAAGPWAAEVASSVSSGAADVVTPHTKNMNLVVPGITPDLAIGVKSRRRSDSLLDASNRLFFITPWRGMSVVGTTHVPYDGAPDACAFEPQDVEGFLDELNAAYPLGLRLDDVAYCYGGLTPATEGRRHGEPRRSRRGVLVDHGSRDGIAGLFSLLGVKYTTAQLVARKAVDAVLDSLGRGRGRARGAALRLPGGTGFRNQATLERELTETVGNPGDLEIAGFAAAFGTDFKRALDVGAWSAADGDDALFRCRVRFAVRAEMAVRLEDVILRRSDRLARRRLGESDLLWTCDFMARELAWTSTRRNTELEAARRAVARHWATLLPRNDAVPTEAGARF